MGRVGAYGKIPALGDFLRDTVPEGFVKPWDTWLSGMMDTAREALGSDWSDIYGRAPIWRFTLSAGLAGPAEIIGVVMPSVDRVGRRFPLTLACAEAPGAGALGRHFTSDTLFAELEQVALGALGDAASRESLLDALAAIAPPPFAPAQIARRGGMLIGRASGAMAPHAAIAAHLLERRFMAPSVWSALLGSAETRLLVTDGLPRRRDARAFFDASDPFWTPRPHDQPEGAAP